MKRSPSEPQVCIKNPADQLHLGEVVDYALNGSKNRRAEYAFFIFVAAYDPLTPEDERGCVIANQPANQVVPLMIEWLERHAPGVITINKIN